MNRKSLRWATLVLGLAAAALAAPTCQGNGQLHAFSSGSLVIPMDSCYQRDVATATVPAYCVGTAQAGDDGILKAYGLVYFLIKHGVAVYWVIDPGKSAVTDIDMTLVDTGEPVKRYDWTSQATASFLGGNTRIDYRGAPFVIDGVDNAKVKQLLASDPDFAQFRTSKTVDIHEVAHAFQAPVAKTLAGLPPTLALLNIKGGDGVLAEPVLQSYLTAAGLNFAGAGGKAIGPHGVIYDDLAFEDFMPFPDGGNRLLANSYKLLWIPHWTGPNSVLTDGGTVPGTSPNLQTLLVNVGNFVDRGNDLFVECAGIGTLEGAYGYASTAINATYGGGNPASRSLESDSGISINTPGSPIAGPYTFNNPTSPFSQIGDFPLTATSGAINDYTARGPYVGYANRLIVENDGGDLFTEVPNRLNDPNRGTVVYLGGHSYTATAGVRLVLNTLFNLSASCIDPNTPCNTGLQGACARGVLKCDQLGAVSCVQLGDAGQGSEVCDGIDNDCDGIVDNLPPRSCYDGPSGTQANPPCQPGSQTCVNGTWGACAGEVLPSAEVCDGVDNDCNGNPDVLPDGGALTAACYDGPLGTENVGICHNGTAICDPTRGAFGACQGEQLPEAAQCSGTVDHDCNGAPDSEACQCNDGDTQPCYSGRSGTLNVGVCKAGVQTCTNQQWGACVGEVDPSPEQCDNSGNDYNCNGIVGDGCVVCNNGDTRPCYDGPSGSLLPDGGGVGVCRQGVETCQNNLWGACQQEVKPGQELCDGKDNDCDGTADNDAICPPSEACINGTCTPSACSGEIAHCDEGFDCQAGICVLGNCGSGGPCPVGQRCQNGTCNDPCAGVNCGAGAVCSGGACVGGGCYDTPCGGGQVCENGTCVNDPCSGIVCPDGDFCRDGYCVQSCVFQHCAANQACNPDGQCVPLPCGGACGSGTCLDDGGCGQDACQGVQCAAGQACTTQNGAAVCVGDPCADVHCPVGVCQGGQCVRGSADGGSATSASSGGSATTGASTATTGTTSTSGQATTGTSATSGTSGTSGGSTGSTSTGGPATGGAGAGGTTGGKAGSGKSGCGCGSGGDLSPIWLAFGGLAIFRRRAARGSLARRSIRRGGSLALLAGLSALLLAACSGSGKTSTGAGGGSGNAGTAGTNAGNGSAGSTGQGSSATTGSGTSATSGTTGTTGCGAGQALCGGGCVDVLDSPDHCGDCNTVCAPDETCDQGYCAPTSPVNPALESVSPDHASPGAQLRIDVVGERFDPQAELHFNGGGAFDVTLSTTVDDAQHAHADLDLTGLVAGPAQVRLVNPGRVISNPVDFQIGGAGNTPTLTLLTPDSAAPGQDVTLDVQGTLFDSTTTLHATGPGLIDLVLATSYQGSSTQIGAVMPLGTPDGGGRGLIPGSYQLFAINGGSQPSNELTFTVTSLTPVLTAVSPSAAAIGAQIPLTATGDAFDPSTVLHFQLVDGGGDVALTTNFVRVDTVQVPSTNPLDLTGYQPGTYQVVAANQGGAKLSDPVPFTISSNAPHVTSVSPNFGREGHTQPITVDGQGFDATSVIHFLFGASDVVQPTTYVSATELSTTLDLTVVPAGGASIAVFNSGNLASNTAPFTVQSNQALLNSLSVSGGLQGTTISETLTGSNFEAGALVHFAGPNATSVDFTPASVSATQISLTAIDLTPYPSGNYSFTVINPNGAQPSAPLPFTVEPGTPTLTSLSPTQAKTNTVVTIDLTGTLFAQGATAHVVGGPDGGAVDTSYDTSYVDPQHLKVQNLSLANVPHGTYVVSVVNPGPHASNSKTFQVLLPDGGP